MPDITFLSPQKDQAILTAHMEAVSRACRETGVVNGNILTASSPADMNVHVAAGRIKIAGTPIDVDADVGVITAAHETLPRIDIIYRDVSGNVNVVAGTPATIEDIKGIGDWKSFTSPVPLSDIPAGAILGAVYVPAGATAISSTYIWMFAGGVGDLSTSIGSPGSDAMAASEKAIRTAINTCAPSTKGVTNGDSHDHAGGDGAQISHANLSNIGTNSHTVIDQFIASKGGANGLASLDAGGRVAQNSKLHASDHQSGGTDAIKLDDLAAPDDNTDLNASTSKHGLMQKYPNTAQTLKGDGTWITRSFSAQFPFGDGLTVIQATAQSFEIPIACKIIAGRIRSFDSTGAPITGSITCSLYKHAIGAAIGDVVDTFTLSGASNSSKTGLNIAISANEWLTVVVSGISTCKQITLSLAMEAT